MIFFYFLQYIRFKIQAQASPLTVNMNTNDMISPLSCICVYVRSEICIFPIYCI